MDQKPKLSVGVIGVGKMGEYHLQKYLAMPDVSLIGIYEKNPERARLMRDKYQVTLFEDVRHLLFEIDAVSIAASTSSHYSVAHQALENGVHALVEKPLTPTVEESERLIELALRNKLVLQVGFVERFRLRALLRPLTLGRVQFVEAWRFAKSAGRETDIDVLSDLMVHDLDLVLSLLGKEVSTVSAIGTVVLSSRLDLANARLEFANGAVANLNTSRVSPEQSRKLKIVTDDQFLNLDLQQNVVESFSLEKGLIQRREHRLESLDALADQCRSFLDVVAQGGRPLVSGEDARDVLQLCQEIGLRVHERKQRRAPRVPSDTRELRTSPSDSL